MGSLSEEQVKEVAQELVNAERTRQAVKSLTDRFPGLDTDDAYKIQLATLEQKQSQGTRVVGKKIGLTSKAMQRMLNVDQPDYGHIFDDMLVEDGDVFAIEQLIQPKIEPEIAFVLARDVRGPGVTSLEVLAATQFVVPALEIIDSRIEGWKIKLCDTIADNASSGRVVLGTSPKRVDQVNLRLTGMVLEKNGEVVQTGAGAAVLGHPANAIAWLANAIAKFGVSLKAGEVIMPGAISAAVDVCAGDSISAAFDGIGVVSVRFK